MIKKIKGRVIKFGGFALGRLHIAPWIVRSRNHWFWPRLRQCENAVSFNMPFLSISWEL